MAQYRPVNDNGCGLSRFHTDYLERRNALTGSGDFSTLVRWRPLQNPASCRNALMDPGSQCPYGLWGLFHPRGTYMMRLEMGVAMPLRALGTFPLREAEGLSPVSAVAMPLRALGTFPRGRRTAAFGRSRVAMPLRALGTFPLSITSGKGSIFKFRRNALTGSGDFSTSPLDQVAQWDSASRNALTGSGDFSTPGHFRGVGNPT